MLCMAVDHGAERTYLALCHKFPGQGIPIRVVQDFVSECPICQKDRLAIQTMPNNEICETIFHHPRSIEIDHVTVTPHDEDGYISLLLVVKLDTKFLQAYPVRDYTAKTVALILFKNYCTVGSYDFLYSDYGSAFAAPIYSTISISESVFHTV